MNLFGPPNVKKMVEKHDVKGLLKALNYKKTPIQYQAIKAMAELKNSEFVEPLLRIALHSTNFNKEALEALGSIKDARAVQPILQRLIEIRENSRHYFTIDEQFRYLAINAVKALAEIGDARAIPEMIANLKSNEKEFVEIGELTLIKLGDTSILPLMQAFVDSDLQEKIVQILCQIGTPLAKKQLVWTVVSNKKNVRERASEYLKLNNIKPIEQKPLIYYSIGINDFESVQKAGENAIPILYDILKVEVNSNINEKPYPHRWELSARIASTLIKLGQQSAELENILTNALSGFKDKFIVMNDKRQLDCRQNIINSITELGQDYEHIIFSYLNSCFEYKEVNPGFLLNFQNDTFTKFFTKNNQHITVIRNFCEIACRDDFNTTNESSKNNINARSVLLGIGYPYASSKLIEFIKDESKDDHFNKVRLSYATRLLTNINNWDKDLSIEDKKSVDMIWKSSTKYDDSRTFNYD